MHILILGSGGREHALAEAVSKSGHKVTVAPGNKGIEQHFSCAFLDDICDGEQILTLAKKLKVDLVVIGPEAPLVAGVADILRENDIAVFGAGKQAAMLEGSKVFARKFMEQAKVPQPSFDVCENIDQARLALETRNSPFIVKADGLAGGKGVIVTDDKKEALQAAGDIFAGKFGDAGHKILIEDGLIGREISVFVLSDGENYHILPFCQDHKRIYDNDQGPNTGGMGAVCPVPWVNDSLSDAIEQDIIKPTMQGLADQELAFSGVLFIGIMVDEQNTPWVLEYNVRFGDPEAEILLPALDEDWADIFHKVANNQLKHYCFTAKPRAANVVILAAQGYPEEPVLGETILPYPELSKDQRLYYGGVSCDDQGNLITAGGRVLAAVGLGGNLQSAYNNAYDLAQKQQFDHAQMRYDIGKKTMQQSPMVGIIMGSKSDLELLDKAVEILKQFEIPFEGKIASAHRTPDLVTQWSEQASQKGIKVIIAAAGLSAALPGVVSAHTCLPVIGLPVQSGALQGVDALYSIAQMPPGVPVASVGINAAVNAALQAIRICAIDDENLQKKLQDYKNSAAEQISNDAALINHWYE